MRRLGGLSILVAAALGLAVSIYNYVMPVGFLAPLSDTSGTPGAALVIFSTCALVLAGFILSQRGRGRGLFRLMVVLSFLGIVGTGLAAYLLNAPILLVLMAVSMVGWLLCVLFPEGKSV